MAVFSPKIHGARLGSSVISVPAIRCAKPRLSTHICQSEASDKVAIADLEKFRKEVSKDLSQMAKTGVLM